MPEAEHLLPSSAEFKNVWIGDSQPGFRKISLGVPREIADYYYYCLLHLSFHSVAVILKLVQTKQIRINIHKRNNTKKHSTTIQITQNTVNTSTHINKTPTH